ELGVAGTAENLQRFACRALGHLAGEQLHHRCFLVATSVLIDLVADEIHELARRLNFGRHLGKLEADRLERADRLPELNALQRVTRRILKPTAGKTDGPGGGVRACLLEALGDDVEGPAFLANQTLGADPTIVKGQLEGLPAEITDLGNGVPGAAFRFPAYGSPTDFTAQPFGNSPRGFSIRKV